MATLAEIEDEIGLTERDDPIFWAVYFLLLGDEVQYIGISKNFASRLEAHIRYRDYGGIPQSSIYSDIHWDSHAYVRVRTFGDAERLESYLLNKYNPPANTKGTSNRSNPRGLSYSVDDVKAVVLSALSRQNCSHQDVQDTWTKLSDTRLDHRMSAMLGKYGVVYFEQLEVLTECDLLGIPMIGVKKLARIKDFMCHARVLNER